MKLQFIRTFESIDKSVNDDELADFIVLTGINGAGKSNLLDSIANGSILIEGVTTQATLGSDVRLFRLSQLTVNIESPQSLGAHKNVPMNLKSQVDQYINELKAAPNYITDLEVLHQQVSLRLDQNNIIKFRALSKLEDKANKKIIDFSAEDYRKYAPLIIGLRDPFTIPFTEVFLSYHARDMQNQFYGYLVEKRENSGVEPLSEQEFLASYGEAPWKLLDRVLETLGLSHYKFNPPVGNDDNAAYEVTLHDSERNKDIRVESLSSGERTLLLIALTLYAGAEFDSSLQKPKVLLLDEADASLHPSMIANLLKVIREVFVESNDIKVILATHSPTTVALADESSLYTMQKSGIKRLKKSSRDEALRKLTVGIPTLSIKNQDRRQVIVESTVDETIYTVLYSLLQQELNKTRSLAFIASGAGGSGNREQVTRLVGLLRANGNDQVVGIVDRDDKKSSPKYIEFSSERYSLENHILDPLAIGLFLFRERHVSLAEMGLNDNFKYSSPTKEDAQKIADYVTAKIKTSSDNASRVEIKYVGKNFNIKVDEWYLNCNGHELEKRLKESFKPLKAYRNDLLFQVCDRVFRDNKDTIPKAVYELFLKLL